MKKQNLFKYICLSFLCICIFAQPISLYAQQISPSDTTVKQYLERAKVLQKQVDYLGQNAYITKSTGANTDSLLENITFTLGQVQQLINEIQTSTADVSPTSKVGRNINFLLIILNYFNNALNELNLYLTTDDMYEEFDALERYLYNKTISDQTITWVTGNI